MSDLLLLLSQLREEGVQLWVSEGHLRYRCTSGALAEEIRSELRKQKREIIALLEEPAVSRTTPLAASPRPPVLPLSFAQEGLWFLEQLGLPGAAYNFPTILRVEGNLDLGILERAVAEAVRRHEVLRTRFCTVDGVAAQVIDEPGGVGVEVIDLSDLGESERDEQARRLTESLAEQAFDLEREYPLRVNVLRLSEAEHVLILNMHHIIVDGRSVDILLRELSELYAAYAQGLPSPLPEPVAQYADYALWQRSWLGGQVLSKQLGYWKARLAGAPESISLPTDRARPPAPSFRGGLVPVELPLALVAALDSLARRYDVTPYMLWLAAFQAVLLRWTGQKDFLVGTPVEGRGHPQADRIIGYFLNTLVLRADLSGNPTFAELLGRVRKSVLDAYEYRDLPFDRLVAELRVERDVSRHPLFQVLFTYQNLAQSELSLPGLCLTPAPPVHRTSKFDLSLVATEAPGGGMSAAFEYAADLFKRETVERLANHLQTLLAAAAADPIRRVSELPLLSEAERSRILSDWNETAAEFPAGRCLHELFEERAAASADSVAVIDEARRVSYAELNERANRLAHHLRGMGIGPGALIGICAERSVEMVVGLLGVLKAGGAYVPLDAAYPRERLAFMLEDARAGVLLTQERLKGLLPPTAARVVCLDADWPEIQLQPATNPSWLAGPRDLAYCIYTSGSTGKPKGVMTEHRAIVNRLCWMQEAFGLVPNDRVLQKTPFSFDVSVWEFFWPLLCGVPLIMARPGGHKDGKYLASTIAEYGVTTVHFVPSMLELFIEEPGLSDCGLRRVICSGEALPRALHDRFFERLPLVELHNLYGPTEAAVDVTRWECRAESGTGTVPIGRPIANTRLYVVDEALRPVPVGVKGELMIGGVQVARGYLGRPALTAERFVPDPFAPEPGARLYRTGDVARYLPDGNIEFVGRADEQVKVRGYRIEPGEIEAALRRCAGVGEAVVVARAMAPGDKRLVAYVVPKGRALLVAGDLRTQLQAALPEYMLPASYVFLDALPLTANGKVDRRALPAPGAARRESDGGYVAPRTAAEGLLCGVWSEVLGVERVGVHDNFFALGGHSLLAARVAARLGRELRGRVSLRDFFTSPTVAEMARLAAARRGGGPGPVGRARRGGALLASFAQERLWFFDQLQPGTGQYNIPLTWHVCGPLDVDALGRSLNEVVRRHEALRTTFVSEGGPLLQVIADELYLPLTVTDLSSAADAHARALTLVEEEAELPFDLTRGPLVRTLLVRLAPDEHVLSVTLHHIISDGWSLDVLARELSALYGAFTEGKSSPLLELPVQYADYAVWQRGWLEGEVFDRQLSYWRRYLEGAPRALELPTDRARPAALSHRGGWFEFGLGAELSAALREMARRARVTTFMALAAGFGALLHRLSGQAEVCVGYPVANRARPEVEYLIGLFVNTLVLRTRVSDELTFEGLLGQVRESVLDADSHQDLPFEKLVEELHEERDASRHPLFQVLFTYQNLARSELHLPRLDVNPEPPAHRTSKFDLSLAVTEGEGGELSAAFEYSSDLFDRETVERLAGHLRTLLGAAASDPGRRVSELPLLGEDERRRILSEWNETAAEFPASVCLHELFEQRAEASGDSVAVVYDGRPMSYAELDGRANRLAHHLRGLGVGPEDRVGVMLERNTELLVALLAVLKAGGAYVPLDGQYPAERLQYMAEDAGLKVLLTETGLAGRIEPGATAVVDVLRDAEVIAAQNAAPVASGVRAENLAYVIYTSGSSGRPKGVQVSHQAVVNFLHAMREQPGITAQDVMLAVTTLSFDIAVLEIYLPLMVGARVVIVDRAVATDGELLAQLIAESGATLMQATPATWRLLFESRWKGEPSLKMLYGGEAMPREVLSKLLDLGSSPWNLYGPTETTVWVTAFLVEDIEGASIIGRPISNIQAYILDKHLQPVPVGVAGELFFAGAGLARGYLGQPAMTAERFIPHPFSTRPGARLYWTGDLARYRPGGEIEFLGRVDHQVKIRGYRIELGEIEAVLSRHAGVTQAVVTAREEGGGEKRLVAYVVATDGQTPTVGELRRHLQEQLPDYMLPNAFVFLAELPLTNNGKVDRRALPAPGAARPESDGGYVAPRTAAEGLLCGVWSEVLGVERVGVHDNFFALGGHSLLAARVAARLGRELRGRVSLRDFFTSPTVAEMARLAAARRGGGPGPVGRARRGGALLASFAQERLWFFDQLQPGTGVFNAPGAWLIKGPLDVAALERSLNEVVRRHETLRTTFIADNGLPLQVIAEHSHTPLPVIDLSGHPDAEGRARALLQEEAELPFDLARGPLIRAFLVRLAPDEHVLSVTLHHIISDGWSLSVLASELRDLYTAFAAGQQSPLAELPVQYADYAVWQRGWLEGEVFDRQLSYWRRYLEGAPRALELPTDRARPAALSHRGGWFEFGLGAELSAALREMARRARVTTFMALAAGFGALLHRLSGQAEVCVGYPVANRARPEVEYLIGLFVNILVMRTRVQPGETFEGLLGQVRESVLDADSHQDLPFDRLVEELRPERDPSRHPLIQVVISYLPQDELRLAGLELTPLQLEERTAKFDLTLFISETGAEIDAAFEYSSDLFDRETIERLASHLRTLLAAAASDPSRKVSGLPLLNEDERRRILSDWNDTSAESLWSLTKT